MQAREESEEMSANLEKAADKFSEFGPKAKDSSTVQQRINILYAMKKNAQNTTETSQDAKRFIKELTMGEEIKECEPSVNCLFVFWNKIKNVCMHKLPLQWLSTPVFKFFRTSFHRLLGDWILLRMSKTKIVIFFSQTDYSFTGTLRQNPDSYIQRRERRWKWKWYLLYRALSLLY